MSDSYHHDFNVGFNSGTFHSRRVHEVFIPAVLLNTSAFKDALKGRPNGVTATIRWIEPIVPSTDDPLGEVHHGLFITFATDQKDWARVFEDSDTIKELGQEMITYSETDGYFW